MSSNNDRHGSSKTRRKSLFALSSLTQIDTNKSSSGNGSHRLRKKRVSEGGDDQEPDTPGSHVSVASPTSSYTPSVYGMASLPENARPPSSVFGSLRSIKSDDHAMHNRPAAKDTEPESSVPSTRNVLFHGEVQTSGNMFRKKKEYLVLTDTHVVRCKSQAKASEIFHTIPAAIGRSPTIRHNSSQSFGSAHDAQSVGSDSSGDGLGKIALRQIVAIHANEDAKSHSTLEICILDQEANQASAVTLQFNQAEERDIWITALRRAISVVQSQDRVPISAHNTAHAVRTLERDGDYDPNHFQLFRVVQRQQAKPTSRSSTDDLSKSSSIVCFLAIGLHKVHLIPLTKASDRNTTPVSNQNSRGSFGILTISILRASQIDDSFELVFRQPLKRPVSLHLAASSSHELIIKLHDMEHFLRPECAHWLYKFIVPPQLERRIVRSNFDNIEDYSCFERTLTAYCIAYDVSPSRISYSIDNDCEDAPRFILLPVTETRRQEYNAMELLAVLRALRYNESFGSICLADRQLDDLHTLSDKHGHEYVCVRTKRGTPLRFSSAELAKASLLVQEVRALASTSKSLRRLDFTNCMRTLPPETVDENEYRTRDEGCGIAKALFPLCRHQSTNVDWIVLSGITLSETDLDYIVGAAVDRNCHFRALELSRCGLSDRTLGLVLDALRAHDNTLEALDISGNLARLSPNIFDGQISVFGFIRRLDLSNLSRTSGAEPLLTADTLLTWRLETLKLSGVSLNERTVQALATYLRFPKSLTLRELILDNSYLSGSDIHVLMQAMSEAVDDARNLHLDVSHNSLWRDYDRLCDAFVGGYSPSHVTLRAMEYRDESVLRHLFRAIKQNKSTRYLDLSRASLPSDASEETGLALRAMFEHNDTLEEIDISGEDWRLETSKFGASLNSALLGLRLNKSLTVLRIQFQKLGLPGASALAEVLKENHTIREIYCEHNDIPLAGFTDMINALHVNTTLVYLPVLHDGRDMALKQTEKQVKQIRDENSLLPDPPSSPVSKSHLGLKRGFSSMKRTTNRSPSVPTPSFPSLQYSLTRKVAPSSSADSSKARYSGSIPVTGGPLLQLSEQDVIAALRLVAESWDRQQWRLEQYLQRNWCILQGIEVPMAIEEEDFERPDNIVSSGLAGVLAKVKIESTPTAEKAGLDFALDADHLGATDGTTRDDGIADVHTAQNTPATALRNSVGSTVLLGGDVSLSPTSIGTSSRLSSPTSATWADSVRQSMEEQFVGQDVPVEGLGISSPTTEEPPRRRS